jgi:putative peptide zinc metalloprotease protein
MRLDGYHIVSDLIGVSDLFMRIKPVIASLLPGRRPDPRVTELKQWARAAVTIWVISTIAALLAMAVAIVVNAPSYLTQAWRSLLLQLDSIAYGGRVGSVVDVLNGVIGTIMLLLPVVGITLTYLLVCRGAGTSLAIRRGRADITLAA